MEAELRIKGKLIIEKISSADGKTLEKRELGNALVFNGALHIRQLAYEVPDTICNLGPAAYRPNQLVLLNDKRALIKAIPSGTYSSSDTGSALVITYTWTDSSGDTYNIYYAGIAKAGTTIPSQIDVTGILVHASAVSPPFSKASTDTVRFTWQITIPYTTI